MDSSISTDLLWTLDSLLELHECMHACAYVRTHLHAFVENPLKLLILYISALNFIGPFPLMDFFSTDCEH